MKIFKFKKIIRKKNTFNNNDIFVKRKNEINDIYHNIELDDNDVKEFGIKFEVLEDKKENHIEPISIKNDKKTIKIENKIKEKSKKDIILNKKDLKEEKKEELFSSPRWKNYQPVEVSKTKVKRKKEDEKNAEEFVKFIDKKTNVKNEEKPIKKKIKTITNIKEEKSFDKKKKYVEHLKKTMDEDFLTFKDIDWELKGIRKEYNDTFKEKDLEKQKEKLEAVYKKIEDFKKKYKDILNNEKFKYLKFDLDFDEKEYDFKYFSLYRPDDDTLKKIEVISKNLDILEKNFEIVKNENEEKIDFVKDEMKKIPLFEKERDIVKDVNFLTKTIINDQKQVIDDLKSKVGKISTETFTKHKMMINYKKLLLGPIILSGIGNRMSKAGITPLGKMAGLVGFGYAFSNFYNAITWKDYNVTKIYFHDYNEVINNGIRSISGAYNIIDSSLYKINDLLKMLNESYNKTENHELKDLIDSLNTINNQLEERKKELDKIKSNFDEAKIVNDKGKILERKMKSENN